MQQPMPHILQERSCSEGVLKPRNELWVVLLQLSKRKPDLWWLKFVSSMCFSPHSPPSAKCMSVVPPICKLLSETIVSWSIQGRAPRGEATQLSIFHKCKCDILVVEGRILWGPWVQSTVLCRIFNIFNMAYIHLKISQANRNVAIKGRDF